MDLARLPLQKAVRRPSLRRLAAGPLPRHAGRAAGRLVWARLPRRRVGQPGAASVDGALPRRRRHRNPGWQQRPADQGRVQLLRRRRRRHEARRRRRHANLLRAVLAWRRDACAGRGDALPVGGRAWCGAGGAGLGQGAPRGEAVVRVPVCDGAVGGLATSGVRAAVSVAFCGARADELGRSCSEELRHPHVLHASGQRGDIYL
mmetsp:Transcript_6799/g.21592  ORF Transcript_6799/g.21592 Transcript_6799/m.21592 type:complete len:204 (-) Transcript_6799:123-734(-)